MLRHTLPPTFALTLALFAAAPAWPCSIAPPSLWGPTAPQHGDEGLPLNTRLVIEQGDPALGVPVVLHRDDVDEAPTPVSIRAVFGLVLVELPELAPNADYTLTFEVDEDSADFESGRDPVSFSTADFFDDEAPAFSEEAPEPVRVDYQPAVPGVFDSCGGVGIPEAWELTIPLPAITDDVAVAGVRLLEIDERGGQIERRVVVGTPDTLHYYARVGGEKTYVVEAFDLAGNVTQGETFTVSLYAGGGCSATTVTDDAAPVALALLLPLLGALRRRRR